VSPLGKGRISNPLLIKQGYGEVTKREDKMSKSDNIFNLEITDTDRVCPIGEKIGKQNLEGGKIPVISCEGACIRGEIARVAANIVAKNEPYRRGCHGELLAVPHSEMANWVKKSNKVVLIDGCFMGCHGRILENIIGEENLLRFDALSFYKKYTDRFDIDSVPEEERIETARKVAHVVLDRLNKKQMGEAKNL
jgi:uncharacterized metal-binding protein